VVHLNRLVQPASHVVRESKRRQGTRVVGHQPQRLNVRLHRIIEPAKFTIDVAQVNNGGSPGGRNSVNGKDV
jgi:hypothetical protein